MKRSRYCAASVLLSLAAGLLLGMSVRAEEVTFRNLSRKYFKDGEGKQLAELVGFQQPIKEVIALKYKVLLFKKGEDGKSAEIPVDPKEYKFKLGDQIRVTVEPLADYYIYIFHVGADGEAGFLLPAEDEDPPLSKKEKPVALPGDGFFEFTPPPGTEQLLVVATEQPVKDRKLLAQVLMKKPGEKLTEAEAELKKTLKATRKALLISVQEQTKQILQNTVLWRGIARGKDREALVKDIRRRGVKQGTFEEPGKDGTSAIYMSSTPSQKKSKLLVTISLTSGK